MGKAAMTTGTASACERQENALVLPATSARKQLRISQRKPQSGEASTIPIMMPSVWPSVVGQRFWPGPFVLKRPIRPRS
jgi:hypothetical protein